MKIMILVHNLTGGGAERVASLWTKGFVQKNYDVVVVIYDKKSEITYELPQDVKIINVVSEKKNRLTRVITRILKLRKVIIEEEPNVIIDVMPNYWKVVAMLGINCFKVSTEHNSFERPKNSTAKISRVKKFYVNKYYNHVTVLTNADKKVIKNHLKCVTVLPNPLVFSPIEKVPYKEKIVLAVGRLDVWHVKGFDILIQAWAKIKEESKGWRLQIVGGSRGEGYSYLKKMSEKYMVSNTVEFVDFQEDILPFYQGASIFVLSSRQEGFGLVLIEAMSQGCACVVCDYKGRQKEILGTIDNGLICETENVNALAQSIKTLIQDDNTRNMLANNSIKRSHAFSLMNIMEIWDNILPKQVE